MAEVRQGLYRYGHRSRVFETYLGEELLQNGLADRQTVQGRRRCSAGLEVASSTSSIASASVGGGLFLAPFFRWSMTFSTYRQ